MGKNFGLVNIFEAASLTHVGNTALRVPVSRCLLETHLASPNRVLGDGVCTALPRMPFGLSCGAILLCDPSPMILFWSFRE
jgi:hypothetical protein